MNIRIFTESSIGDSYIYGMFNTSGEIQTRLTKALQNGKFVTSEYLEEQLLLIERTRFSPLFQKIINAYKAGVIRLIYIDTIKLTKSLPFIVHREGTRTVATIFLSSFGKVDFDNKICDIPAKTLYVLMESAYLGIELKDNGRAIRNNTGLLKICNDIYTTMALRILNRDYALSLDVTLHDKTSFCLSRFFLDRVWECVNPDIIFKYATGVTTEQRFDILNPLNEEFISAEIKSIADLFGFMKTLAPRLGNLSVRFFVERYINTYGGASILSIDYLPYLMFVISNILIGGYIVNQTSLNDIVKNQKEIRRYYGELSKIV